MGDTGNPPLPRPMDVPKEEFYPMKGPLGGYPPEGGIAPKIGEAGILSTGGTPRWSTARQKTAKTRTSRISWVNTRQVDGPE